MGNTIERQLIGISSASRFLGWSAGKFGGYFYSNRTPKHTLIDNKPVWLAYDLLEWAKTIKRKNKKTASLLQTSEAAEGAPVSFETDRRAE